MNARDDAARIARERAEMEAADAAAPAEPRVRGGDLIRVDFRPADLERLRRLQAERGDEFRPTEEELAREGADDLRRLRVERRRARLSAAGVPCPPDEPVVPGLWTPRRAWERVTEADRWQDAAHPAGGCSLQALQALDGWLRSAGSYTAALLGFPGTGKTVAAWWALAQGRGGVFVRPSAIGPHAEWDALRKRAKGTEGLVVINDVKGELQPSALHAIAALIEERHEEGRRTLLTSNHPRRDRGDGKGGNRGLASMLGDRFVDRFEREGLWVGLRGESLRGRRS